MYTGSTFLQVLYTQIRIIFHHRPNLQYSPSADPRRGWFKSVTGARAEIEDVLEQNPSLARELDDQIAKQTARAIDLAIEDLEEFGEIDNTSRRTLRSTHYSQEQILGRWFPPEPRKPTRRARDQLPDPA